MPHNLSYVGPTGDPTAKIALVGEQPGQHEVLRGSLFIGPAGENLNECLRNAGIPRSSLYITNVVKDFDRPIREYIDCQEKGVVVVSPEGRQYIDLLKVELEQIEANIIIACGNVALWALGARPGITNWRGSVFESTLLPGRKVMPIIHPATYTAEKLFSNPAAYLNKYLISMDLKKARVESDFPEIKLIPRKFRIKPAYHEVLSYLHDVEEEMKKGTQIDYDIELVAYSQELSCIGFALNPYDAMCIPFVGPNGDWFNPEQETTIMLRIEELMSNPSYKKRGQYVIFDSHFLLRKYGIRTHNLEDTMVYQKILYPEFKVGLDFIAAMWTDVPYYKADGKLWISGVGKWEQGWNYNCLDTLVTADAAPKQRHELEQAGNLPTYERQVRLIEPLTYMMERGIKADVLGMEHATFQHEEEVKKLQAELNGMAGKELNANSPKQLIQYFYVDKKITPYTKKKRLTVNEDALKRIARKGFKEASTILSMRRVVKRKGTYLTDAKVDTDGRMRCSYNPVGTKFSRISSSENIFGTGTNLQNWPHDLLRYLTADEGYVYYGLDLSQFENRVVAYVGNIPQMIQVFEEGRDSHRQTAALIFNKEYEDVSGEPGSSDIGDGLHSERDWGKQSNHAFNYGRGYRSFGLKYEIPEEEAKWIYNAYHRGYPGLKNNYWAYVKNCLRDDRTLVNLFGRRVKFYGQWGDKLFNVAYSCIPQGTCGDLINERGLEYVYYNRERFEPVELLTQIHDSIGLQIPLSTGFQQHAKMLIDIKQSLNQPLEFHGRTFDVPVDLVVGFNLCKDDGKELKGEAFSDDVDELAASLEHIVHDELIPF